MHVRFFSTSGFPYRPLQPILHRRNLHRLIRHVGGVVGKSLWSHLHPNVHRTRTALTLQQLPDARFFSSNTRLTRPVTTIMDALVPAHYGTPATLGPSTANAIASEPASNPISTDHSSGLKRKREAKQPKFYAVRIGKSPGIYHNWADCLSQVRGFPKAMFKSFSTLTEAQLYVEDDSISDRGGGVGKVHKWYGVRSGRVPGVYTTWEEVLGQITGWKLPKHKVFKTRAEAERYVTDSSVPGVEGSGDGHSEGGTLESIEVGDDGHSAKKVKTGKGRKSQAVKDETGFYESTIYGAYEPGDAPFAPDTIDNFDSSILLDQHTNGIRYKTGDELLATKYQATVPVHNVPLKIWTDGSTLANGQADAVAGVGVYFGPLDGRNVSEALSGNRQTNQRAELTAILRALEIAPKDRKVIIISDSNYAIKCSTEWFQKWRSNNWQNASRKPVDNKDLVVKIIEILEDRQRMNSHRTVYEDDDGEGEEKQYWECGAASVKFVWVKGHAKDKGNEAADGLATEAARHAKEMLAEYGSD